MKLDTLIKKLSKAHNDYRLRYGKEPVIFGWDDGTLLLCSKITPRGNGCVSAGKPEKAYRIKRPGDL